MLLTARLWQWLIYTVDNQLWQMATGLRLQSDAILRDSYREASETFMLTPQVDKSPADSSPAHHNPGHSQAGTCLERRNPGN